MSYAPDWIGRVHTFIDFGWPWVLAIPLTLLCFGIIVSIGIWSSMSRRNQILQQQTAALKYQAEVLRWLGQKLTGQHILPLDDGRPSAHHAGSSAAQDWATDISR